MVSKTRVSVSALSSALSVMMSSFPAHFRILDILRYNDKGKMFSMMVFHLISLNTVTDIHLQLQISSYLQNNMHTAAPNFLGA